MPPNRTKLRGSLGSAACWFAAAGDPPTTQSRGIETASPPGPVTICSLVASVTDPVGEVADDVAAAGSSEVPSQVSPGGSPGSSPEADSSPDSSPDSLPYPLSYPLSSGNKALTPSG